MSDGSCEKSLAIVAKDVWRSGDSGNLKIFKIVALQSQLAEMKVDGTYGQCKIPQVEAMGLEEVTGFTWFDTRLRGTVTKAEHVPAGTWLENTLSYPGFVAHCHGGS